MIRHLRVASLAALVAATAALAAAPSAFAEERSCRGTLGAITVDNLRVPQGATCTLNGTRVKATVKVERAATLHATGIRVIGNVQAGGAARVNLKASNVGAASRSSRVARPRSTENTIKGDVQFFENRGAVVISSNRIDGNLRRVQNGYIRSGTRRHARPLRELKNRPVSRENVPARAREWTRVPHLSFPRNEGVRGSSPRVGLRKPCKSSFLLPFRATIC